MYELHCEDGAVIRYDRRPATAPVKGRVLLVHALAMDSGNWDEVLPLLPDDLDVVRMDVRGHGRSTNGAEPLTLETATADMAALLAELGWSSAVIAGCSMGGCISIAFAQRHPALTAGLVLIDTTAFYGEDAPAKWGERVATAARDGFAALLPFQVSRWFTDEFRASRPDVIERCTKVFCGNDLATYRAACTMLAGADLRAGLGGIAVPVVVVVGEEDYATPLEMARVLQQGIPDAQISILKGVRHFTPLEAPGGIARAVGDVVARTGAGEAEAVRAGAEA